MTDGVHFFWFAWIFWVTMAYLVPRSKTNLFLKVWILLVIAVANTYLLLGNLTISMAILIIFLGGLLMISQANNKYYLLFTAFTLMITYDCVLVWEHEVPIWLIVPKAIFLPLAMTIMIIYLTREFLNRLAIAAVGICGAELFYGVILLGYRIPYTAGSKLFLDHFVSIIATIVFVQVLRYIYTLVKARLNNPKEVSLLMDEAKKEIH